MLDKVTFRRHLNNEVGRNSNYIKIKDVLHLSKNPKHHSRTKHIDIQHYFIWEEIEDGIISMKYCATKDMLGDVFIKTLIKDRH